MNVFVMNLVLLFSFSVERFAEYPALYLYNEKSRFSNLAGHLEKKRNVDRQKVISMALSGL